MKLKELPEYKINMPFKLHRKLKKKYKKIKLSRFSLLLGARANLN